MGCQRCEWRISLICHHVSPHSCVSFYITCQMAPDLLSDTSLLARCSTPSFGRECFLCHLEFMWLSPHSFILCAMMLCFTFF